MVLPLKLSILTKEETKNALKLEEPKKSQDTLKFQREIAMLKSRLWQINQFQSQLMPPIGNFMMRVSLMIAMIT